MDQGIGIGMAGEALGMSNLDAAQNEPERKELTEFSLKSCILFFRVIANRLSLLMRGFGVLGSN